MKKAVNTSYKNTENENALKIYFSQIKAYPLLDFPEELELSRLVQKGDKNALHKLVNANLRLVVKIARPYKTHGVPFLDLIQEGNMGLIHAAEKYDHSKNFRFCTYAGWWIRQYILRYLSNKRRIVRLPHRKEEMLRKIQRSFHSLSQTLMHQPRSQDIAVELGIPVKDVDLILNMSSGPLSLEVDGGIVNNESIMEIHEDYTYNPERAVLSQCYRESTRKFLNRLKDRERQVIFYRYQLESGQPQTLKEIGDKLSLSPETVRQIEMRAINKIRRSADELRKHGLLEAM